MKKIEIDLNQLLWYNYNVSQYIFVHFFMISTIEKNLIRPRSWLERYKAYERGARVFQEEKTQNIFPVESWKHMIDHIVTYSGGRVLILDGKIWGEAIGWHLSNVKKIIERETSLLRKHHMSVEYAWVIFYGEKIPGWFQKTEQGFYLVNPKSVLAFAKEMTER